MSTKVLYDKYPAGQHPRADINGGMNSLGGPATNPGLRKTMIQCCTEMSVTIFWQIFN